MIIGIDASRANRERKTGTEWYSYYLIRWLAKIDDQNQYILYTNRPLTGGLVNLTTMEHDPHTADSGEPQFDKKGYQILQSPYNNFKAKILHWPSDYLWTQGRLSFEMAFKPVDALFIPAHALPVIHPKASVVTIHDVGFQDEVRLYEDEEIGPKSKLKRRLLNLLVKLFTWGKYRARTIDYHIWSTKYALEHAARIITVSDFSKQELAKFSGKNGSNIEVVYNGYNRYIYQPIKDTDKIDQVLHKYGIEKPYLFYVGRIERKKNIPRLIEAFAILKENNPDLEHTLVLAGDASFGYDETNYIINEFNLDNDVYMPGWIEEADLPYLFNGAEVFVFPSNYEGFGIPLLQAMACGVPIIASDSSSIPEVVENAAVLFDPADTLSIAHALEKVLHEQISTAEMVSRGQDRVKHFSWENTAQKTLGVIKDAYRQLHG